MKVALIGNQNSGKTTLFNSLTKSNQKVGNWPGVTIQKKEGYIANEDINVVDLPGVYSLCSYTSEEVVTRQYLLEENPDVIVNVVDASSLERSLYLTAQLLEFDARIIVALNMIDLLEKNGLEIDCDKLSQNLGVAVVPVSALKNVGLDKLVREIKNKKSPKNALNKEIYSKIIEKEIKIIEKDIKIKHKRFLAIEQIESENVTHNKELIRSKNIINMVFNCDPKQVLVNERYKFAVYVKNACVKLVKEKRKITDKIDKIILNKWLAIPIFMLIMSGVYFFSVGVVGKYSVGFISNFIDKISIKLSTFLLRVNLSDWLVSLVVDGVVLGVGAVLSFLPELVIMFLFLNILETSGYMSRVSFIFDKIFRKIGLSGKSIVPFIVGSGCSVPAIMSCKTIENEKEKKLTISLVSFIPCSAKLPIIALFSGYFFSNNSGVISVSLYFLAIIVIILSAFFLKKFLFKTTETSFISELPDYKLPNFKYVIRDVLGRTKDFVVRAGSTILICSMVIWFLSSFNWKFQYGVDIDKSLLAWIGNLFGWFFYTIVGEWNWAVSVSALQGIIAKEQVVSSLTVISKLSGAMDGMFSNGVLANFTSLSAYSYVVFNLFSAPCLAAIGAMKSEIGSRKHLVIVILYQILFAWAVASLIFGVGRLCGL